MNHYSLFLSALAVATMNLPLCPGGEPLSGVAFESFSYKGTDPVFEQTKTAENEFYNPIIAGYYPDPSICRVGEDYYLVNSTFSYFPGVPIFHSKNLVNWRQIGHVLARPSQLNLDGLSVSSGIFAPAITHHKGRFYMITTNVNGIGNFFVTTDDPAGPWSDPVKLAFEGIDPSIFFDDDGKAYIVHNGNPPDNNPVHEGHRAIWMWEFDPAKGEVRNGRIVVNGGVDMSQKPVWIEGPHLFKHSGWYYLCCAEGGTGPNHSQVIFRTRSLDETFTPWSENPILTQRDLDGGRKNPVISTGHADLVETPSGEWWAVFLGIRPYEGSHSNLGREAFLLPVTWVDGWPRILEKGKALPRVLKRPSLPPAKEPHFPTTGSFDWTDDFEEKELGMPWVFLRTPREKWWSLDKKQGSLLIEPRDIPLFSNPQGSSKENRNPSFVARRQQHEQFTVSTTLEPGDDAPACDAGLAALQNDRNYFFLGVKAKEGTAHTVFLERHVRDSDKPEIIASVELEKPVERIELRIEAVGKDHTFAFRSDSAGDWQMVKEHVDGRILSSESAGGFVGTVLGMYARLSSEAVDLQRPR